MTPALDEVMMRRAIAVGWTRMGQTRPNPCVGCVIVLDGTVIAEAATAASGRPHAEEQALAAAGNLARGADCYVTLEPCAERSSGAASCADRIIAAGVRRVFIACEDVSPRAAGQGLERLRDAGVAVELGLLAEAADILSAGFRQRLATGRPRVEAAEGPASYEGRFDPRSGEDLGEALSRLGQEGFNRLWTPRGGDVAHRLERLGWLSAPPPAAIR